MAEIFCRKCCCCISLISIALLTRYTHKLECIDPKKVKSTRYCNSTATFSFLGEFLTAAKVNNTPHFFLLGKSPCFRCSVYLWTVCKITRKLQDRRLFENYLNWSSLSKVTCETCKRQKYAAIPIMPLS